MVDIGDVIRDYQIVEHIGRGGMADVWSARDAKLSRMVAVKTIAHSLSPTDDPVGMFQREAKTIANLEHPHILPIYDFGDHAGSLYIVMRYVSGGSLAGWMDRRQLTIDEVVRVGRAMADALDYAHASSVVHLDLKPQNILLDGNNAPYLADFGLATALDPGGRAANPGSGTLMYMAPEQLTSETLDRRADIYSFALLLYHLLNGRLPFDGASPMVMKQLQFSAELPPISGLPEGVTLALRRSVDMEPDNRHATTRALMDEVEAALGRTGVALAEIEAIPGVPSELVEPVTLYERARAAWDFGNGRFLLGVTHFMVMEAIYARAGAHGLSIDTTGLQVMLRGALEYGINVENWWARLGDDDRRWVCLHAVRSANAPARVRALSRLETLPDDDPPRIPAQVAQALQKETDAAAKRAALRVLSTRAVLRKGGGLSLRTEYVGRMLNTLAHVQLKAVEPQVWSPVVYGPEIDLLMAEMALDVQHPSLAEAAARSVGNIRSEAAVKYLDTQRKTRRSGSATALAVVRDEAGSLPPSVSPIGQGVAWLTNSALRLRRNPLSLTWRVLWALLFAWLARAVLMWLNYPLPVGVLSPDRIVNSLGVGLLFGVMVGALVLLADEVPARMRGFWGWPLQAGFGLLVGWAWGTLALALEHFAWLRRSGDLQWDLVAFGGFGLAVSLVVSGVAQLRAWSAVLVTGVSFYLTIFAAYNHHCVQNGVCADAPPFSVGLTAAVGLALGVIVGTVLRPRRAAKPSPTWQRPLVPPWGWPLIGAGVGVFWAMLLPSIYSLGLTNAPLTWVGVVGFVLYGMLPGVAATYLLRGYGGVAFTLAAAAGFVLIIAPINGVLMTNGPLPASGVTGFHDALFYTRYLPDNPFEADNAQVFTLFPFFALLLAVGVHLQLIFRDVMGFVRSRRRQLVADPAVPQASFINQPDSFLPNTATLLDAVAKAKAELQAAGLLQDMTPTQPPRRPPVDLDAPTGKVRGQQPTEDVRRLRDEDK